MNKFLACVVLIFAFLLSSCATTTPSQGTTYNPEDIVRWSDTVKLSWDDFTGEPESNTTLGSEIIVLTPATFHKPTFLNPASTKVECFMVKNASWVVKAKAKKQLLTYNQTLFDIYELSARKLRKRVVETNFGVMDPVSLFNGIYSEHNDELSKIISQYRSETEIGNKAKKLTEWSEKIAQELKDLEAFKDN
jgi:hypothetical protein